MATLTRKALYDLVWEKPVRTVAVELGISGVALKKVCARFAIPVPHRGHWARIAAGQRVHKSPLPPRGLGMPDVAFDKRRRVYRWPPDPVAELAEPEPVEPVFEETLETVEARIRKTTRRVKGSQPLAETHPQLTRIIEKDAERRRKYAASRHSWDAPVFDSPFEQRRLRVINSLFWGLTHVGAKPWISGQAARTVGMTMGEQNVSFSIDHPNAKRSRWNEEQAHGGNVDTLRLEVSALADQEGCVNTWIDANNCKLETRLTEIVVMLQLAAEVLYRRNALNTYRRSMESREQARIDLARLQEEAERIERERVEGLERLRRERLLGYARDHRAAEDIRAFTMVVLSRTADNDPGDVARCSFGQKR